MWVNTGAVHQANPGEFFLSQQAKHSQLVYSTLFSHYSSLSEHHNDISRLTTTLVTRELFSNLLTRKFIQVMQIKSIWKQKVRCQHLEGKSLHRGALSPTNFPYFFIPGFPSDQSAQGSGIPIISDGASEWIFRVVGSFSSSSGAALTLV